MRSLTGGDPSRECKSGNASHVVGEKIPALALIYRDVPNSHGNVPRRVKRCNAVLERAGASTRAGDGASNRTGTLNRVNRV
jgi:hypothetical protein